MKEDLSYIFFFIFALLALAIWNTAYLDLMGIRQNSPNSDKREPAPTRGRQTLTRFKVRRREIDNIYMLNNTTHLMMEKSTC